MQNFLKLIGLFLLFSIIGYLLSPDYVKTGVKRFTANIDDYKFFENRKVEAGTYQPWKIASDYNTKEISVDLLANIEEKRTTAYVVIQDGQIKYEKYWDGYNANELSGSFSMAKSIVSLLIGIAIDEGKIDGVDDKVSKYLPQFIGNGRDDITIKNVLTMSSGLNYKETYFNPFSKTANSYYGTDLNKLVYNLKSKEPAGERFEYRSGDTQIAGMIVEAATGKALSEYTSEKIWKKIGAKHNALWSLDHKEGIEKAFCCFNSNARDFARLGQLILNDGRWDSTQIISETYLDEAITPANYLKDGDGEPVNFYGYFFWIVNHKGYEIPYYRGILGQFVFAIPDKNAVVVRLGHRRAFKKVNHHPVDVYAFLDAAFEILD